MSDKIFLLLIVVFCCIGVMLYLNYVEQTGAINPFASLIDLGGLAKSKLESPIKVTKEKDFFNFNLRRELLRLSERQTEMQAQRHEMIKTRTKTLNQLLMVNDKVKDEAIKYAEILISEEKKFLDLNKDWTEVGKEIMVFLLFLL